MESLRDRLLQGRTVLSDGASGTWLMARGLPLGQPPEWVNLNRPELLEEIAALYMQSGAELIQTNTFGASPLKLDHYGLADQTETIIARAVQATRQAAGEKAWVNGSVGPTGKLLLPYGDTDPESIYQAFFRQIRSLLQNGVDALCIETMSDPQEAALAIRAARELSPEIPILATMTFEKTTRGFFTIMGTTVAQAVQALTQAGADALGSNCGNGSAAMALIAAEFHQHTDLPLVIQANAGLPQCRGAELIYPESPEFMAGFIPRLVEAGVRIIGGCCGTTPEHIRFFRHTLDQLPSAAS